MAAEFELRPLRYNTVAASPTAQVLIGPANVGSTGTGTGATGDILESLLVVPATTSPGAISILDNSTSITVFTGGANSVSDLKPFLIVIGARSQNGPWKVTTGANVAVIASGRYT